MEVITYILLFNCPPFLSLISTNANMLLLNKTVEANNLVFQPSIVSKTKTNILQNQDL